MMSPMFACTLFFGCRPPCKGVYTHEPDKARSCTLKALVYRRSVPLYLAGSLASRLFPRRFFSRLTPLDLREIPTPAAPEGYVTLRNRLCGICGSDLHLLQGSESYLLEPYGSFPAVLGHETVSEIVSAAPGEDWNPGDRVVVEPILPCFIRGLPHCKFCSEGEYHLCENFTMGKVAPGPVQGYNRGLGGGMADYSIAHPSRLIRVPLNLPDEAAVLTDSLASALHPVLRHFPGNDQCVLIFGAGILGQQVLRSLRALGSSARTIVVARHSFQRDLAYAGGADEVLMSPSRIEIGRAVKARFLPTTLGGGNLEGGADLLFDCVGTRHSLQEGLLALRARGKLVMVATIGSVGPVDFSSLWFRELHVTGSAFYSESDFQGRRMRTYQRAIDLLASEKTLFSNLVSHIFPLASYQDAFRTAIDKRTWKSMKVAFSLGTDSGSRS